MHRDEDVLAARRDRVVTVAARRDRWDVMIDLRQIRRLACRDVDAEVVLPLARAPIVPVSPHEPGPDLRLRGIVPVALIDFLIPGGGPLDVALDDERRAIR